MCKNAVGPNYHHSSPQPPLFPLNPKLRTTNTPRSAANQKSLPDQPTVTVLDFATLTNPNAMWAVSKSSPPYFAPPVFPLSPSNVSPNPQESSWEYPAELKKAQAGADKPKDEWVEKLDANSGNYYYYNRTTKETTWDKPADFKPVEKPAAGVSNWASKVDPGSGQVSEILGIYIMEYFLL